MHSFQIFYLFLLIVMCYCFFISVIPSFFGNLLTTVVIHIVFPCNFSNVCFWSFSSSVHFVCMRQVSSEMLSFWVWAHLVFEKKEFYPVFQQLKLAVMFQKYMLQYLPKYETPPLENLQLPEKCVCRTCLTWCSVIRWCPHFQMIGVILCLSKYRLVC